MPDKEAPSVRNRTLARAVLFPRTARGFTWVSCTQKRQGRRRRDGCSIRRAPTTGSPGSSSGAGGARFRERILELGQVTTGSAVLDVGCGTGTLAVLAKERVGPSGAAAHGVDASPEMIARARRKAGRAGLAVSFEEAVVEDLPLPGQTLDAVLSTLMLHHLPRSAREQGAREMRRVAGEEAPAGGS